MIVLILNAGSSSLKAALMDSASGAVLVRGLADWAGAVTRYEFGRLEGDNRSKDVAWKSHGEAVKSFVADLTPAQRSSLAAVGHRIVHGGQFTSSVPITPEVRTQIMALADLAPLHNPPSLETLTAAEAVLSNVPHVAVFDTAFHATMPSEARTYPVPAHWTRDWGIRRYGFHGLNHAYCARRATELLGSFDHPQPPAQNERRGTKFVICHLGHGCSASAVRDGKCLDTTMGFTPLDGLMMATRCGSIDPSILLHVQEHHGLTTAQVEKALNRESGLLGVSGVSADMRQVLAAAKDGHAQAQLALAVYTHRVRQAVGALAVTVGGLDALVFTAGVGENAVEIRASVCAGLDFLGLELDREANAACRPDADVASQRSRSRILVIAAREDVTMLHEVVRVVDEENQRNRMKQ